MVEALLPVAASLAIVLLAAEIFTNSIQWLGNFLDLGAGPVGSVLADIGAGVLARSGIFWLALVAYVVVTLAV